MKFICLGYIEEAKWDNLSDEERQRLMKDCFDYDDELRRGGHFLGGEALDSARHAVTLRVKDGSVDVTDGPYAETREILGGILLLEARDLNHAVSLMSNHPGVKMGPFEIRPAAEEINSQIADRDKAFANEKRSQE
ncbi:YciI family protein [Thalassoglobus polymorphus]|uniref:YCII-related domain protein n=1 Tax=Thalassoglobus polymorphus TaxID=2527994 RepID=A0A517QT00_9PLAN|nr:YciI family protein [Thalassoglobus polymorphus]QDT34760.1 YCII-related domain protein [Thalassoglobus polymorphus]